mgnify:FL=1
MKIAICEDNTEDALYLKKMIHSYCLDHNISIEINLFETGENCVSTEKQFDILFVDIYLKENGINGIQVCQILQKKNPYILIIFTTSSRDYAIEAFSMGAVHYLLKPFSTEHVFQALSRCIQQNQNKLIKKEDIFEIKQGGSLLPILQKDIIYIEIQDKLCTVHTTKTIYQTYSSLDSIFKALNSHYFMKAQRSYIVNMNYIESLQGNEITLKNNIKIAISRKYRLVLKKQYQDFLFSLIRQED